MSLEQWLQNNLLRKHDPTIAEIKQLLQVVDREISDAGKEMSADSRFSHLYNAGRALCDIALRAEGYKTSGAAGGRHNHEINSLTLTLGKDEQETMIHLSRCSRLRGQAMYERIDVVSDTDADELEETVRKLRGDVTKWLAKNHPDLVPA